MEGIDLLAKTVHPFDPCDDFAVRLVAVMAAAEIGLILL